MSLDRREAETSEPFPTLSPVTEELPTSANIDAPQQEQTPRRTNTATALGSPSSPSSPSSPIRARAASLRQTLIDSNPPLGAWQAIGQDTAKIPTLPEIRNGGFSSEGWSHEGQLEMRHQSPHEIHKRRLSKTGSQRSRHGGNSARTSLTAARVVVDMQPQELETHAAQLSHVQASEKQPGLTETMTPALSLSSQSLQAHPAGPDETGTYPNGYRFPKKHTWKQSFAIFGKAFWKFFITPSGFLITVYGLNVVAWGAMIFFLLIPGATPAMCESYPDCENKTYSARQIWIENTSQILNALFCVTGFGLLPWRARDFYFMIRKQLFNDHSAHRKLAGYYSGWYRLPASDSLPEELAPPSRPVKSTKEKQVLDLEHQASSKFTENELLESLLANPSVPLPPYRMAPAPLTGIRAPPTGFNKLVWMIWAYIWNTLFQVALCVVMWGFTKYNRPSWATALFIVLGCGTGMVAGYITFREAKKIKEIEGVPVKEYDTVESVDEFKVRVAKKQKKSGKGSERVHEKETGK